MSPIMKNKVMCCPHNEMNEDGHTTHNPYPVAERDHRKKKKKVLVSHLLVHLYL